MQTMEELPVNWKNDFTYVIGWLVGLLSLVLPLAYEVSPPVLILIGTALWMVGRVIVYLAVEDNQ